MKPLIFKYTNLETKNTQIWLSEVAATNPIGPYLWKHLKKKQEKQNNFLQTNMTK